MDGRILHIYKGQIQVLAKLGKEPCGNYTGLQNLNTLCQSTVCHTTDNFL